MAYLQYIIPAAALIIVQIIISAKQQRVQDVRYEMTIAEIRKEFDMTIAEIRKDISRLENKQDKHNQLIERMTRIEDSDKAQWKQIDEFKRYKSQNQ